MAKVKASDFIASAKQYVGKSVDKANKDKNAYLTKAEARGLPKDLRDNVATHRALGTKNGQVGVKKLKSAVTKYASVNTRKADKNKDGFLSAAEQKLMPKDLRDNVRNFVQATNTLQKVATQVSATRDVLFDRIEAGVAKHDWHGLLPLFDKENRKGQHELGVNDYQYLAEGFGLHNQNNQLPGPVTRADTLDLLSSIKLNRTATTTAPQYEEYSGKATLKSGKSLVVDLFIKPVAGGFVIDPPVG